MSHVVGLISAATASHPSRIASSGIASPPANGSSTRGARPRTPLGLRPEPHKLAAVLAPPVEDPVLSLPLTRSPLALGASTTRPAIRASSFRRASRLPGSGNGVTSNAARIAANGRHADQMCSVEM